MSLYLKYRPPTLSDMVGNKEVISTLDVMLQDKETCPHSFLLHGDTGCGKTTIGRIIASRLNSKGIDFHEVDSASFRGIDTIRKIINDSQYSPLESECIVWLIDECHKMTSDAQNALLKILEDTPKHVYFILATTAPEKLIKTIRGRCTQFQLQPLPDRYLGRLLKQIARKENNPISDRIVEVITRESMGLPRNAIQILEQVLIVPPGQQEKVAEQKAAEFSESIALCKVLLTGGPWDSAKKILSGLKGQEVEQIRRHVMSYAAGTLLRGDHPRAGLILEEFREPFYNTGFPELICACHIIMKN